MFAYKHCDDIIIGHSQWSEHMHTHTIEILVRNLIEIYATIILELNIITFLVVHTVDAIRSVTLLCDMVMIAFGYSSHCKWIAIEWRK